MFTDRQIRNMRPESKTKEIREGQGFGIRVQPNGTKTFFYGYSSPVTRARRLLTLGEYPGLTLDAARIKHGEAYKLVKSGGDPLEVRQIAQEALRSELTFEELATEYLRENVEGQLTEKSVYYIRRILLGSVRDGAIDDFQEWRTRKVASITTEDVAKLLKSVSNRSAAAARNIIKTARPMFAYALARTMVKTNPFILAGIKSFLSKPVRSKLDPTFKSRTLNEDEIRLFWKALPAAKGSPEAKDALRLMLLTGQRPSEVLGLHSAEISGNWWTLPKERTKARLDVNRTDVSVNCSPS